MSLWQIHSLKCYQYHNFSFAKQQTSYSQYTLRTSTNAIKNKVSKFDFNELIE